MPIHSKPSSIASRPERQSFASARPTWSHMWLSFVAVALLSGAYMGVALFRSPSAASQVQFAYPAFQTTWQRTDGPVASLTLKRPWVWGPVPGKSISEPFAGLPGNSHLVQYFDKGRMEINNPNGDPKDPFFVTNGLLAVELISGQMQTGANTYENKGPAQINLASDADDPSAPTYQSFNGVSNIPGAPNERRKSSQVGQPVRTAIDRQGVTQPWPSDHPDYGVRIAQFIDVTGHNIPDVFWSYLSQQTDIIQDGKLVQGPLFYPWFSVTGYPISEPYWAYVKVSGSYTDVLIQAYERRVLTYVPHLPSPYKVQMGNIGQHYYDWRYLSAGGPGPIPGPATPTAQQLPPKPNITIDAIAYRKTLTDLNGNYVTITNAGKNPQSLNGWWIDSPKWSYVDRFYFPGGVTMQPGTSINVHAGLGGNSATDLYMGRTTVMWDGQPYDLAILYDNYGRQISNFFPASDVGVQPTQPPAAGTPTTGTPGLKGTATPTVVQPVSTPGLGTPTLTPTKGVPNPNPTGEATLPPGTVTVTTTPQASTTGTVTVTVTGTPATPTRTPTRTP